jgi:hypothetical protein
MDAFLGLVARRVWRPTRERLVRWCGAGGVALLEEVVGDGVLHLHNANFAGHGAGVPDGDGGDGDGGSSGGDVDGGRSRSGSSGGDSRSSTTGSSTSAASTVVFGGEAVGEVAVAGEQAAAAAFPPLIHFSVLRAEARAQVRWLLSIHAHRNMYVIMHYILNVHMYNIIMLVYVHADTRALQSMIY